MVNEWLCVYNVYYVSVFVVSKGMNDPLQHFSNYNQQATKFVHEHHFTA